jgi:RNA polymerase sigma factor (sigma-70 family)
VAEAAVPDTEKPSVTAPGEVREFTTGSFIKYVESTKTSLYVLAFRLTRNRHLAEDLLSQHYSRLWEKWPSFAEYGEQAKVTKAYSWRAINHLYVDFVRRSARRPEVTTDDLGAIPRQRFEDPVQSPEESALHQQAVRELWAAVSLLPEDKQIIIHEIYVEGLRIPKVAALMGYPEATVRYKHNMALRELRRVLGDSD